MGEGTGVRVRFPTLEVYAARSGGALASRGRPLTPSERKLAKSIFRDSIELEVVRIVLSPLASAPTTLGNFIRVAPPRAPMSPRVLIHELTHVWQYQTKGTQYISDSLWHQVGAAITAGSRDAAYDVTIVRGQSIHRYPAEHQAMIVETYFADPSVRTDPEYARMIGEVRRSRPIPASLIVEEAAFGSGMDAFRMPERGGPLDRPSRMIPIFRLEF